MVDLSKSLEEALEEEESIFQIWHTVRLLFIMWKNEQTRSLSTLQTFTITVDVALHVSVSIFLIWK